MPNQQLCLNLTLSHPYLSHHIPPSPSSPISSLPLPHYITPSSPSHCSLLPHHIPPSSPITSLLPHYIPPPPSHLSLSPIISLLHSLSHPSLLPHYIPPPPSHLSLSLPYHIPPPNHIPPSSPITSLPLPLSLIEISTVCPHKILAVM